MFLNNLIFLFIKNNKYGFIDINKNIVIPFEYDNVSKCINELVWCQKNNQWNLLNYKNELLLNNQYNNLISFNGNYSIVEDNNNTFWLIDHKDNHSTKKITDKKIIPVAISDNNLILFKKNNLFGFLDSQLNIKIDSIYQQANSFYNNLAVVCKENKWGIIDSNNKLLIDYKYDYISSKCDGFIKVGINNQYYLIDINENHYLKNTKYEIDDFSNLMLGIKYKNKKGYMNQFFEIAFMKKFDEIQPFYNEFAVVKIKNKYGVVNKRGKYVLKPIYDKIIDFDEISFFCILNSKYVHVLLSGMILQI